MGKNKNALVDVILSFLKALKWIPIGAEDGWCARSLMDSVCYLRNGVAVTAPSQLEQMEHRLAVSHRLWRERASALIVGLDADEICSVVRVSITLVRRNLRIGAKRARHFDTGGRVQIIHVFRRDNCVWCDTLFHPLLKSAGNIMLRIDWNRDLLGVSAEGRKVELSKEIRSGSAIAVLHAWDHVKANELICNSGTHGRRDNVIIVDGSDPRRLWIAPAVIKD